MNNWIQESLVNFISAKTQISIPKIVGLRRMEHADIPSAEQLTYTELFDVFWEPRLEQIYEKSCLSFVQSNETQEVISCICLCNYPNVSSVTPRDWPCWLHTLYKLENVTERNAAFVHYLAWDERYRDCFFKSLLTELFEVDWHLQHVILVVPPRVILADVFEQHMTRIPPKCSVNTSSVQSLYVIVREQDSNHEPKIRRVVEEDNDDVIPIIDAESNLLKDYYGEYYISEIVRHSDNQRQLIVSEDHEGVATGVMFLNSTIDVDLLNEHFELAPYNGLRKPHKNDPPRTGINAPASELFCTIFSRKTCPETNEFMRRFSSDQSLGYESDSSSSFSDQLRPSDTAGKSVDMSMSLIANFSSRYCFKKLTSIFENNLIDFLKNTVSPINNSTFVSKEIKFPATPVYHGAVNAFVMEILALQDHMSNCSLQNFLRATFDCFPNVDYCVILFPFSHPFLPFLKYFVRVPLRCYKDYPMTLYLTHRAALLGRITCREAELSDRDKLQDILQDIPKSETIMVDFDAAMNKERRDLKCYVFQWNDCIVGLVILCTKVDTMYIRRRFHVEDYIAMQNIPLDAYAYVQHFVLMPIFSIHLQSFFREIMRLSDIIVLYYRLTESLLSSLTRSHPLAICLNFMTPVRPRQRIQYKFQGYIENDEPETKPESFSLFMTTPRLSGIFYSIIDTRVVVVGASDCGLAFLEHIVFGALQTYNRFTSLTIVSINGLPYENQQTELVERMIPFSGRYCCRYRRKIPMRAFANVVFGTVLAIDRREKYVTVMNQGNISYDYLILTCGMQYHSPRFEKDAQAQKKEIPIEIETPWNCITINNVTQAAECLDKIQLITNNLQEQKRIIFYGHNLACYCALQALLDFGVNGSWITLVRPPLPLCDSHDTIFFNDCEVYQETMQSLEESGVTMLVGWEMVDWHLKDVTEGKVIESVVLQLKRKMQVVNCDALLNFKEKTINLNIFLAICQAGLVFDGQLVIDSEFKTNDPSILAAGTMTKYCRKLHAESWQHKYYNSIEIGERMSTILRLMIHKEQCNNPSKDLLKTRHSLTLPIFRAPNIVYCILPGGYRYLHIRKPGKRIQRKMAIGFDVYGDVLTTGSCNADIGYFRIRLNHYNSVETITCMNKKDFEVYHIIALYGKHESMLNDLKTRFQKSLIIDLYAYFREPWAMAIYYDRFECLRVDNRATLLSKTAIIGESLTEDCIESLIRSNWQPIADCDRRCIESKFSGSVYHQEIEESLLDFLQFSKGDLPVYCLPGMLRDLYVDIDKSPLYSSI